MVELMIGAEWTNANSPIPHASEQVNAVQSVGHTTGGGFGLGCAIASLIAAMIYGTRTPQKIMVMTILKAIAISLVSIAAEWHHLVK